MSIESARAFCVRMMSDEDFRGQLLTAVSVADIEKLVNAEYSMSKEDFSKAIGGYVGHTLAEGELEKLITEFFQEQSVSDEVCKTVLEWINTLN